MNAFARRANEVAKSLNIVYNNISDKNIQEVSNQLLSLWREKYDFSC